VLDLIWAASIGSDGQRHLGRGRRRRSPERGGARPRSRRSSPIRRSGGQSDPSLGRLASTWHAQATGGESMARPGLGGARHGEGGSAGAEFAGVRGLGT